MQRVEIAAGSFRQLLRAGWRALVGLLVLTCLPGAAVGQTVPPEGQVIAEDAEDLPEPASRTGTPVPAVAPPPALPAVIAPPPALPAVAPPPAPPAAIAPPPAPPPAAAPADARSAPSPEAAPLPAPATAETPTLPADRPRVVDRPLARLAQKDLDYPLKLAGLSAGAYQLARVTYLHLEPRFDYPFLDGDLLVNVAIPLNFLIYDETVPEELAQEGMGTLRDADWDELPGDLLRVFRRLEYGHPEAPLWLRLGGNEPITLGQGALLRRVGGELALDRVQPVAGVGWKHPAGGLLLLTPDASTWEVLAVQGSLAPARLFTPDPFWGGLLFSVSYAFDRDAPFALRHAASGKVVYDRQGRPSVDETVFLQAVGATLQLDLLRSPRLLLQQYLDYSAISGRGGAFTVGLLQRYSFADELFALEVRTELLTHDADYLPGYFDELYLVEREGVVSERLSAGDLPKAAYLQSLTGLPRRVGYQLELAAAFPGWAALAAALQDVNEGRERRLLLHGEVPATRWLHLFLTYEKRNFAALLPLFDFNEDNQVFYHGIRLSLTPWAALCYRAQRAYQVDLNARERKNVFHFQVDAEVGWGF